MNEKTMRFKARHIWLYIIAGVASLGGLLSGFDHRGDFRGAAVY